jgi:hypothetical protein
VWRGFQSRASIIRWIASSFPSRFSLAVPQLPAMVRDEI